MGPVPEQVLPGTSTGPLKKVNTLNPQLFTLNGAGISGGGTPRPPGQEDPDPSPQHVQGPGGLRPGQAGCSKTCFLLAFPAGLPWAPRLGPPGPPWAPLTLLHPPGPPWAPLGPPGPPWASLAPLNPPKRPGPPRGPPGPP